MAGRVSSVSTPTLKVENNSGLSKALAENTVKAYTDACKKQSIVPRKNFIDQVKSGKRTIVLTTSADVLSPADLLAFAATIGSGCSFDCLCVRSARKSILEKNEGMDALGEVLKRVKGFKTLVIVARGSVHSDADLADDEDLSLAAVSQKIKDFAEDINLYRRARNLGEISVIGDTVYDIAEHDPRLYGIK